MFRACASMPRTSATVLPARSADRVFTPLFTVIAILSPPFFFYFLFFLLSRPRCGGVRHDVKIHLGFLPIHFSLLERIKRIEHQSSGGENPGLYFSSRQVLSSPCRRTNIWTFPSVYSFPPEISTVSLRVAQWSATIFRVL